MPRPKRTKVASAAARVAKPSKAAAPAPAPAPKPKPAKQAAETVHNFSSDDSDGLVVRRTRPQRRMPWQSAPEKNVDYAMTGGLSVEEPNDKAAEPKRKKPSPKSKLTPAKTRTPSSTASKKARTSTASKEDSIVKPSAPESLPAEQLIPEAPADIDDSLTDTMFTFGSFGSESPAHGTRPPSAMKILGTPAHETSVLALKNFKRRPRQPSLLRMVNQTTDVEDNDLDDLDDLDDFNPDAESTALNLEEPLSANEHPNNSDLYASASSSGSRGRKRKLSSPVVQVPRSSPPFDPPSGADVANSRSASPSLPEDIVESCETVPQTQEEADPEIMSETMAPPRSSSPPADEIFDSPVKPRQQGKRRETKKKPQYSVDPDSDDDVEPEQPVKSKARQKPKAQSISTAKLQSLLPRRRTRVAQGYDEFDIRSSDEADMAPVDSDQDELQLSPRRLASTSKRPVQAKATKKSIRTTKKSTMTAAKSTMTAAKSTTMAAEKGRRNTRTYGRTSSDKENERTFGQQDTCGDVEDITETTINVPKSQLSAIAKQFEEVDAWEMDFESVDVGGASSSPWR
ncbi:hypothetical protein BCR34DRAFT_605153 [Clohesyomyces aquaticus]|uniref:Uncharacterized protein n=1 Tax=Clohesyomyces aquaticus TaxID=1231657 RepID=A0A1Y1Z0M0_9PLEO|nr:hypothetical protein BCR34DRAFT_605153 [Clohesyomyces aquaticus]